MATVPCPACEGTVSPAAPSCPHCGHPMGRESAAAVRQQRVTTQSTAKSIKGQQLGAAGVMIVGLLMLMASEPEGGAYGFGGLLMFGGFVWFLVTRFTSWWQHG